MCPTQSIIELVNEGGRLRKQRDLAYELINAIPGVSCVKPQAALYMFPRLDPKVYPIQNDQQFFLELLQETKVMLVQVAVQVVIAVRLLVNQLVAVAL